MADLYLVCFVAFLVYTYGIFVIGKTHGRQVEAKLHAEKNSLLQSAEAEAKSVGQKIEKGAEEIAADIKAKL